MLSEWDVTHVHDIMAQPEHAWFSARLLRMMQGVGGEAKERLAQAFPAHVALYDWWWDNRADAAPPLHLANQF